VGLRPERADPARTAFAAATAGDFPQVAEEDWITRDGQVRRVSWTCTALVDAAGRLRDVIATGLDVTDQRRTERLLTNVLAATTEQAIFATDPDGTIVVFNAGAEKLLGYTAAELVGQATPGRLHLAEEVAARGADLGVPPSQAVFTSAAREGHADTREWVLVRKDGSHVPVSMSISVMRDDRGEVIGFVGVARDVTAERLAATAVREALRRERAAATHLHELNEIRTGFVANVSHELRTPLTSIIGATEIMLDEPPGDRDPSDTICSPYRISNPARSGRMPGRSPSVRSSPMRWRRWSTTGVAATWC
jgi:PAS domain S-box-containing protein